jgi:21S rRNA (GM2251-2'-O)-methyltransferase
MQSLALNGLRTLPKRFVSLRTAARRQISLTGAIERGKRQAQRTLEGDRSDGVRTFERPSRRWAPETPEHRKLEDGSPTEHVPQRLPYTTASSEFIYGTYAVKIALKAGRRQLHKLYILRGVENQKEDGAIERRAHESGTEVIRVTGQGWRQLFDRTTGGHPHNGYILETSPIPTLSVSHLEPCEKVGAATEARLAGDAALDNMSSEAFRLQDSVARLRAPGNQKRHPLLILLDRVTDLGNLGAIMRSAYFFGVDGIILLDHGTAPLSAVTVKASAGAAERVPILRIKDETSFIKTSQDNGWHFLASISPDELPLMRGRILIPEHDTTEESLKTKPMVLMMGNEGEGLRPRLARMADSSVSIQDAALKHDGVDSLNVSVAAAILMHDLLRPFLSKPKNKIR